MKRVMTLILLVCLMLAFSAMAESNPDDSLSTETRYAAVKALLTGNPEVTPEQAQITLEFLSIVHTKLGDAFRKENREKAADAVSLLLYIEEKDPEIYSRVMAAVPEGIADTKPSAYILNIRSNRFHRPECTGLTDMSDKNRVNFFGSREILLATGFKPCQICMP